ncbi:hypothetical protein C2E23DRAFT_807378 [Lenzites betulinus]|nr:hypothetical protein C2E23DRAFT_807378 [Lenzites betulinus]
MRMEGRSRIAASSFRLVSCFLGPFRSVLFCSVLFCSAHCTTPPRVRPPFAFGRCILPRFCPRFRYSTVVVRVRAVPCPPSPVRSVHTPRPPSLLCLCLLSVVPRPVVIAVSRPARPRASYIHRQPTNPRHHHPPPLPTHPPPSLRACLPARTPRIFFCSALYLPSCSLPFHFLPLPFSPPRARPPLRFHRPPTLGTPANFGHLVSLVRPSSVLYALAAPPRRRASRTARSVPLAPPTRPVAALYRSIDVYHHL